MRKFGFYIFTIMFFAIFVVIIFIAYKEIIDPELYAPLITIMMVGYGYVFSKHQIEVLDYLQSKTQAYDKYLDSLFDYKYKDKDENYRRYQTGRSKLCLYASDETIRVFKRIALGSSIKEDQYNTDDPMSKIVYAIRKEINPKTTLKIDDMIGVDPSQWTMELSSSISLEK